MRSTASCQLCSCLSLAHSHEGSCCGTFILYPTRLYRDTLSRKDLGLKIDIFEVTWCMVRGGGICIDVQKQDFARSRASHTVSHKCADQHSRLGLSGLTKSPAPLGKSRLRDVVLQVKSSVGDVVIDKQGCLPKMQSRRSNGNDKASHGSGNCRNCRMA